MFRWRFLTAAVAAVAVSLGAPLGAQAAFTLTLTEGSVSQQFDLTTMGSSGGGIVSGVSYSWSGYTYDAATKSFELESFTFGQYSLTNGAASIIVGETNLPGGTLATLSLDTIKVQRTNVGGSQNGPQGDPPPPIPAFTIELTASGFTAPTGNVFLTSQMDGKFNLPPPGQPQPNGVATLTSSVDGLSSPLSLVIEQDDGAVAANLTSGAFNAVAPYSITHKIVLENMGVGVDSRFEQGSISSQVKAVPAPAGLIMALTAVPFLGVIRRRLRQTAAPTTAA